MIDIVVPYYNDYDEKWRKILFDYMEKEGSTDRQVTGEERYRDWDCFKYWFRCVEKNCPWVNKVFLIVASESQIPKWINRDNPKLRIVLHEEFLPKELLPTFNPMTFGSFIWNIKDLSDNYVACDDDYYFLNPISPNTFFIDGFPVYKDTETKLEKFGAYWLEGTDGTFYQSLNNGIDLQLKLNGDKSHWYALDHLPVAHKKDFEGKIVKENYDLFIKANSTSRFRNKDNINSHVFTCLYKDTLPYYKFNIYRNSCYLSVRNDTNFENFGHYDMICFNDTQLLKQEDFVAVKNRMVDFFEKRFPKKSTFEK